MKLIQHGTKYVQTITCNSCGAKYQGTHFDENVKAYDTDYTSSPRNRFFYYFKCEDCGKTIEFNKKAYGIGDK